MRFLHFGVVLRDHNSEFKHKEYSQFTRPYTFPFPFPILSPLVQVESLVSKSVHLHSLSATGTGTFTNRTEYQYYFYATTQYDPLDR